MTKHNNIRKYREMCHLTQEQLGAAIGLEGNHIGQLVYMWESQRRQPSAKNRKAFEEFFAGRLGGSFSPDYLFIF